jgi:hypothetical protein|tara:strand:+ start:786 stop:1049 length:264 start_codon:yes stop_codon:yes gene_type:complete
MIESLLIIIIGFSLLFYFIEKANRKLDFVNEYQLNLFKKEYQGLLRNSRDYNGQLKEMNVRLDNMEKKITLLTKQKEDKKNIFSFKK